MKPISITVEGFLSFKERTEILFDGLRLTSVTGVNGAGKSSIISAIAWAIYGETRVSGDRESVINDYCDSVQVELVLQDRLGQTWLIERSNSRGASMRLAIHENRDGEWVRYNSHRNVEAQEKIEEVVGISEDAFYSLMVIKQGGLARFAAADSDTRRSIIMGLLPELDVWSTYRAVADDFVHEINAEYNSKIDARDANNVEIENSTQRLDELESEISGLSSLDELHTEIERLEGQVSENRSIIESAADGRSDKALELSTLKAKRDARNAETRSKMAALEAELKSNKEERSRLSSLESSIERRSAQLDKKRTLVQDNGERLEELERDIASGQEDVEQKSKDLEGLNASLSSLSSQIEQVEESHQALEVQADSDSAECLICKSPLTNDRAHELMHDIQEKLDDLEEKHDAAERRVSTAKKALRRAESRLKELRREQKELGDEVSQANGSISSLTEELEQLRQNLQEQSEAVRALRSDDTVQEELDDLELEGAGEQEQSLSEEIREMDQEHPLSAVNAQLTREIREKRAVVERISRLGGQAEAAQERISDLKRANKGLSKSIDSLFTESEAMEWVRFACTQKGVPNDLIASILDQIQDEQNAILSRLLGDRAMQVEFRQERRLKTREGTKAVLDIVVHTESPKERVIESFSGGEQVRLTLSNFMAMIKVFNERVGNVVSMLYLDEPFGAVDGETIPIIVDILRDALDNNIVDSILVVSHDPRFAERIPQNLAVSFDRETMSTLVEVE